ncbi:hypothetical protein OUZ56_026803 [Daphnia magna]|uniref:Uncharacterized protein n=1 Tax=Daphnia magna TaxID=35525 RepID=A0ABQ9ZMZ1_9CRUS|nr:hypothetical protein OUZ56_026803 [Daphnia magna]
MDSTHGYLAERSLNLLWRHHHCKSNRGTASFLPLLAGRQAGQVQVPTLPLDSGTCNARCPNATSIPHEPNIY